MVEYDGRQGNFSSKMYGFYTMEQRQLVATGAPVSQSFLMWHRTRQYDATTNSFVSRGGRHQQTHTATLVVACRYWFELTDGFWGQFSITQLPHLQASDLLPSGKHLLAMQNFAGILEYVRSWRWHTEDAVFVTPTGGRFHVESLPLLVDDAGDKQGPGKQVAGELVFAGEASVYHYITDLAKRDLQYRGFRDNRLACFQHKQEANFLLYRRVLQCTDANEYEMLRQAWDTVNRPQYRRFTWGPQQQEALDLMALGYSYEDEDTRRASNRFLFIKGKPGSGKSLVLLEAAVRACPHIRVLIVCPTGMLVNAFKSKLPEVSGIENISVDTIHGVLNYKRPGADSKVSWSPPTALRQYDLILCDEGSQYDDPEWERLFASIKEQPHSPFTVLVADFQQLQPVSGGVSCHTFCDLMQTVELGTVYRSSDPDHLLFQNRIRETQPSRRDLVEYFGDRHWHLRSLMSCVAEGMRLQDESGSPFVWLTNTNSGASDVCRAALKHFEVTADQLALGYLPDPTSKSDLRIVATPGLLLRLTRNFDKQRGSYESIKFD